MEEVSSRPQMTPSPAPFPRRLTALGLGFIFPYLLLALAGCATVPERPAPIEPADLATAYSSRRLSDEGLHQFLVRNAGLAPADWPPATWDFQNLSWVAFYFHPSLEIARAAWATAQAGQTTAAARPNPSLTISPGYAYNGGGDSPWFPGIGANIPIETGNKRDLRSEAARLTAEAARQDVFAAAWKVRGDLHQALIDSEAVVDRVGLLQEQVDLQAQIVELLGQRLDAGAIAAPVVADARLTLARDRADLTDAQAQLPLARQRVAAALGLPLAALDGLEFALAQPPALTDAQVAAAKQVALQTRPDVLAALARYNEIRTDFETEAARRLPDISFGPSYQWDQGTSKWSLDLSIELPVFNQNEGPIAEAAARSREAAANLLALQAEIIAGIEGARAEQVAADASVPGFQAVQSELEQKLQLLQGAQAAGAADSFAVLSAQAEVLAGRLTLLDATTRAASAAARLEDALQVPFGSLEVLSDPATLTARDDAN